MPTNPARKATPVTRENHARPLRPSRANRPAATMQAAIRHRKSSPPTARCSMLCQPFASRLHACRERSKPSRVTAWTSDTVT
jgi:hypothetical protein